MAKDDKPKLNIPPKNIGTGEVITATNEGEMGTPITSENELMNAGDTHTGNTTSTPEETPNIPTITPQEVTVTAGQVNPIVQPAVIDNSVVIRTLRDHHCTIGGTSYEFEKGREYTVPKQVRMVLMKQNILRA